jgi:hypothetical protein
VMGGPVYLGDRWAIWRLIEVKAEGLDPLVRPCQGF